MKCLLSEARMKCLPSEARIQWERGTADAPSTARERSYEQSERTTGEGATRGRRRTAEMRSAARGARMRAMRECYASGRLEAVVGQSKEGERGTTSRVRE